MWGALRWLPRIKKTLEDYVSDVKNDVSSHAGAVQEMQLKLQASRTVASQIQQQLREAGVQ